MTLETIKVPDIGEGVAEVEIVEWNVAVGDVVREDDMLASVMTDKAAVEIPSPANGVVEWLGGDVGDVLAVGSDFIKLNLEPGTTVTTAKEDSVVDTQDVVAPQKSAKGDAKKAPTETAKVADVNSIRHTVSDRPIASPAVRKRVRDAGARLSDIAGTGPAGRITHDDFEEFQDGERAGTTFANRAAANASITRVSVMGLRRNIARRMQESKRRIPHYSYVEEVDVSTLMELREELNEQRNEGQPKLSILPFMMMALVKAVADFPAMNARYNDDEDVIEQFGGVHVGIATQTDNGLLVPVVRHAESRDIWDNATELEKIVTTTRQGAATREQLTGSTITITSLGALGGIVSTPVINYPEVAIIGINKIATRPVWVDDNFVPRQIMNLSSSFDHRVVDGYDAASFIHKMKSLIEHPATIFMGR